MKLQEILNKIEDKYDEIDETFYDDLGFLLVSKNDKWGILDEKLKVVVPVECDSIVFDYGNQERFYLMKGDKFASIDLWGKIVTPFHEKRIPLLAEEYEECLY